MKTNFVIRILLLAFFTLPALAQDAELRSNIDKAVEEGLKQHGVPSASVAVVKDGRVAYVRAYGQAKLDPAIAATPEMRYSIGSISKQFTAAAVLLLAEEGKLKLDDKVGRFFPQLTRANDVTIRQLLSMTSGYQDYWPQDYLLPEMAKPTTTQHILDKWAGKPLDFEPGTKYQYSNTNYVIAGMIVEKATGMSLWDFLQQRIFKPLGMIRVMDIDAGRLTESDPVGYERFALSPPRATPKEGAGWLFAAGGLAMTAGDLAKWNVALIERKVLKPASYREFTSAVRLENGAAPGYALGVNSRIVGGRFALSHSGEVMGFVANNVVYPEERAAITVLTNQMTEGAGPITNRIAMLLFATASDATRVSEGRARKIFAALQRGEIDRSRLTENAIFYFSDAVLKDFASSLGPLGAPTEFVALNRGLRGGMVAQNYRVTVGGKRLAVLTFEMPDGKIDQFMVQVAD